jgi:hypothetical protein
MLAAAGSGSLASAQSLPQLPTAPVTPTVDYSTTFNLPAFITAKFSGLPSGLGITNGETYLGWCADQVGALPVYPTSNPILFSENNQPYKLYNTYQNSALPADAQSPNWSEVNYILNHKGNAGVLDIQQAIWYLLNGSFSTNSSLPGPIPSQTTLKLLADAKSWCGTFFPGPGQVVAVLLDIHGLKGSPQDLIIEVPVPDHCWFLEIGNSGSSSGYGGYSVSVNRSPDVVWLHAQIGTPTGLSKTTVTTVQFTGVTMALNGRTHQLPDGLLIFDPSALATPTTTFDSTYASTGRWVTTLNPNALSDEIFFDGSAIPVDSTISRGGKAVISYRIVSTDENLVFPSSWSTKNFTSWPGNSAAEILPYHQSEREHAGTPQNPQVQALSN